MLADAVRFAIAILLSALGFTVWDIGTRTPVRLARDVAAAVGTRRGLLRGAVRLAGGLALLVAGGLIARPALPSASLFGVIETVLLAAGLLVEQLVGPQLRARSW